MYITVQLSPSTGVVPQGGAQLENLAVIHLIYHSRVSSVKEFSGLLVSASLEFAALWLSIARTYSPHNPDKLVESCLGAARPGGLCSGLS